MFGLTTEFCCLEESASLLSELDFILKSGRKIKGYNSTILSIFVPSGTPKATASGTRHSRSHLNCEHARERTFSNEADISIFTS